MTWTETRITDWAMLTRLATLTADTKGGHVGYMFRGQCQRGWSLQPSLARLLHDVPDRAVALEIEQDALGKFTSQAHLYLPPAWLPPPGGKPPLLHWWPLMQHYSAPTRLLDWTWSAYAAAYFAVSAAWGEDGILYAVQGHFLLAAMNARYGDKTIFDSPDFVSPEPSQRLVIYTPPRLMDRLVAQQGVFTVCYDILADHGDVIHEALEPARSANPATLYNRKYVIPAEMKPEFMLHLRQMNITASSLYPGGDGLGRSVTDRVRVSRALAKGYAPTPPSPTSVPAT